MCAVHSWLDGENQAKDIFNRVISRQDIVTRGRSQTHSSAEVKGQSILICVSGLVPVSLIQ